MSRELSEKTSRARGQSYFDLFAPAVPQLDPPAPPLPVCEPPKPKRAATITEARGQRDEAIAQVRANAENSKAEFTTRALEYIPKLLAAVGQMSGEDISDSCRKAGIIPHDDRAFGVAMMILARRGVIEKCGTCQRRKGHATSGGNVWRLIAL